MKHWNKESVKDRIRNAVSFDVEFDPSQAGVIWPSHEIENPKARFDDTRGEWPRFSELGLHRVLMFRGMPCRVCIPYHAISVIDVIEYVCSKDYG